MTSGDEDRHHGGFAGAGNRCKEDKGGDQHGRDAACEQPEGAPEAEARRRPLRPAIGDALLDAGPDAGGRLDRGNALGKGGEGHLPLVPDRIDLGIGARDGLEAGTRAAPQRAQGVLGGEAVGEVVGELAHG